MYPKKTDKGAHENPLDTRDDVTPEQLLSVGQAAKSLDVYVSRIDRAMKTGKLPHHRVGPNGTRYCTAAALQVWADTHVKQDDDAPQARP